MRLALTGKQGSNEKDSKVSRWASLPGLCCQAAGGEAEWADDVTLAWLLFYAAADLMDSVQDQDEPDEWWQEKGPGAALAAASGLYFSGSFALDQLNRKEETAQAAPGVITDFYHTFLTMTSGQYQDLTAEAATLEDYWRQAASKSGAFFQLACLAGARLASSDPAILGAYGDLRLAPGSVNSGEGRPGRYPPATQCPSHRAQGKNQAVVAIRIRSGDEPRPDPRETDCLLE